MRIPIHALIPLCLVAVVAWCLRWHFREEKRRREEHAEIARELRDNDARERLREAERQSREAERLARRDKLAAIRARENRVLDVSRETVMLAKQGVYGDEAERLAAAQWN